MFSENDEFYLGGIETIFEAVQPRESDRGEESRERDRDGWFLARIEKWMQ